MTDVENILKSDNQRHEIEQAIKRIYARLKARGDAALMEGLIIEAWEQPSDYYGQVRAHDFGPNEPTISKHAKKITK